MTALTPAMLSDRLALADELLAGRTRMFEPQDLPGRYGRVVQAVDHLLDIIQCEAVLGGGWAVWRHGYVGRVTQDIDIALPSARIEEFLRAAAVSGFKVLPVLPGRWSKLRHRETNIEVVILPEGGRPGTATKPAPTTVPAPTRMGAAGTALKYINLPSLIELKLAAGRARDESDIVELVRFNPDQVGTIAQHLASVHPDYVAEFDALVQKAREQDAS
jgi:hypothetical protein